MRKKKSVPSGSGHDAVPSPAEFSNLDWLANHINQRTSTVTNMQSHDESKGDADHGEEEESPNSVEDSLEYEERSGENESPLQSGTPVSPSSDSPSSSSAVGNDGQPKRSAKQKGKTPKIPKATSKRPWTSNARKANGHDVDMALLKTATSLADRVLQPEQPKKSRTEEEEDEVAIYCRSLANRLGNLPVHVKRYVRLQIKQLMCQVQFSDHPIAGMPSGMFSGILTDMTYQRPEYAHLQPL